MRLTIDFERLKDLPNLPNFSTLDGVHLASAFKRNLLGAALRAADQLDPKVAAHIMSAQRELFAAGAAFFEEERRHAARAAEKYQARADAAAAPVPPPEASNGSSI